MTDREKLEAVAKGYHKLMVLEAKRRALIAEMIRACLSRIVRDESEANRAGWRDAGTLRRKIRDDKAVALKGLRDLAAMLDNPTPNNPSNEGQSPCTSATTPIATCLDATTMPAPSAP